MQIKYWKMIRDFANKKIEVDYLKRHGCNSCCPRCRVWESEGNFITTIPNDDGSETRICSNCNKEWKAVFTPAGFVEVKDKE